MSRAVLVISDFTGLVGPLVRNPTQLGERSIAFDFTLTETGGQSGAIIKTIRWTLDGVLSPFYTGEECWGFNYPPYGMVGPGETLHSLKTDWGYYCDPGAIGVPPVHVGIIITFVDDRGVSGTVEATTFVE